jgi:hypothetical protein
MAAAVPDVVKNMGACGDSTLLYVHFPDTTDDTNTWASGLGTRVVSYWASVEGDPTTQASVGIAVEYTASTGTFTLHPAEDETPIALYILVSGS